MAPKKKTSQKDIEIAGSVNIKDGDFVAGDKNVAVGDRGIYVGGNVERSTIVTGDQNGVGNMSGIQIALFDDVLQKIEHRPNTSPEDKEDLKVNVEELKAEAEKGEDADETFLSRRLRNIERIAPDIADVVLATIANPAAGFASIVKKVAERARQATGG